HLAAGEVDDHRTLAVGAVALGVADEVGGVKNLPGLLAGGVVLLGTDKHIAPEQVVPGGFSGHLDRDVVLAVLAYVKVGDEAVPVRDVLVDPVPEGIELVLGEGAVDWTPGAGIRGAGFIDDEAIGGRSSGAVAGGGEQGPGVGEMALAAHHSLFNKFGGTQVGVHIHRRIVDLRHRISPVRV